MKHTLTMAALLCAAACVSSETHRKVLNANDALQAQMAAMAEQQRILAEKYDRMRQENDDLSKRAADASWIEDQKKQLAKLMERYGSGSLASGNGVEMVQTAEGMAIRVPGEILFSPGSNNLSDQGRKTLSELAAQLQNQAIRIEGHTDDQPIARSQWGTNLRLSVERAMVVADFLTKTAGLKSQNVNVAGYSENRPARTGNDDETRQKNRRVEILLLK